MASALDLGEELDDPKLHAVYDGCRLLTPISELLHVPIDQVNFLTCHAIALLAAYPFRHIFHPSRTHLRVRHSIELALGLFLAVFCFGRHCLHLIVQSTACYLLIVFGPRRVVHIVVFVVAMSYLAGAHMNRQIYHYGSYTLDITGPMMVMTQKLTSLAFSLHDGTNRDGNSLTPDQKKQMIRGEPTLLEFYSYMFYFHGVLCGPLSFYNDYIAFIDGSNFSKPLRQRILQKEAENSNSEGAQPDHAATAGESLEHQITTNHVIRKLGVASVCGIIILAFPTITPRRMTDASYFELSFVGKIWTIYACMAITRQRYYLAWTLAEAVNHNAGLGFRGFDENDKDLWDQNENVHILNVEFSTSLKQTLDHWNIRTSVWLRRIVYERVSYMKTLAVFGVSAVWHGFYPGYYLTFFSAAFFTVVSRKVRRVIRPYFQTSARMARFYDVITMVTTWLAINYLTAPFSILRLRASIKLLGAVYWYIHVLALLVLFVLVFFPRKPVLDKNSNDRRKQE